MSNADSSVQSVALSPDGKHFLAANVEKIYFWDIKTGDLSKTVPVPNTPMSHLAPDKIEPPRVSSVELTSNGRWLVWGGHAEDRFAEPDLFNPNMQKYRVYAYLTVVDVETGKIVFQSPGGHGYYVSVRLTSSGRHMISSDKDIPVKVWHVFDEIPAG